MAVTPTWRPALPKHFAFILTTAVILTDVPGRAQSPTPVPYSCRFVKIPMRDGVSLNTSICEPRTSQAPLPFLLTRTPYGIAGDTLVRNDYRFLAEDGYIFVFQDIRGRYGSDGEFIMQRPLRDTADPKGVDETTDTYDTVEWLLKNVPNNSGRAGALGVSYPGFLATMAGINPHPAMKAISPQAPMTDTWMGGRLFSSGRLSVVVWFRICRKHGAEQRPIRTIADRPVGHVRLVPGTRPPVQRQCQILSREGPDME